MINCGVIQTEMIIAITIKRIIIILNDIDDDNSDVKHIYNTIKTRQVKTIDISVD
jgi:hypothetical protein